VNLIQGEIVIPKVCQIYKEDFGTSEENILRFIFKYINSPDFDEQQIIRDVCYKKTMIIKYE
jgi:hypothetical protein